MQSLRHASAIAALLASAAAQTVTATATGSISCSATTLAGGATTQSLPPGSPLPNGTSISTQSLSSVSIGVLLNPAPGTAARYSISESSTAFANTYPPFSSGSSNTSCQTVLALTANPPAVLRLLCTWTHSAGGPFSGTYGSVAVDIGNDGTADWGPSPYAGLPGPNAGLTAQATFFVLAGATPTLIGTNSQTGAFNIGGGLSSGGTWSSQLVIDVSPSPPPRCSATAYSTECGATLTMMDLGAGSMQFTGAINFYTGDPALLVLGLQPQTAPLPFSANCSLLVVPFATLYSANGSPWLLGPPPPLPGNWTFDVQSLHFHAPGSLVFASGGLQIICQ